MEITVFSRATKTAFFPSAAMYRACFMVWFLVSSNQWNNVMYTVVSIATFWCRELGCFLPRYWHLYYHFPFMVTHIWNNFLIMCLCVYVCVHTSSVADLWCLENSLLESIHIYLFGGWGGVKKGFISSYTLQAIKGNRARALLPQVSFSYSPGPPALR